MLVVLAALPILVVGILMLFLMWPSCKAMPVGWAIAAIVALSAWNMPVIWVAAASIAGIINALDILIIVFGALLILQLLRRSGAIAQISVSMATLSSDRRIQVLVIAWFMGGFLEGAAGFGTPAAIGAPLLVGMGFPPFIAAVVTLLASAPATIFGAVGVPVWGGFETIRELSSWPVQSGGISLDFPGFLFNIGAIAAIVNLFIGTFLPLFIISLMTRISSGSFKSGFQIWPVSLIAGVLFTLPQMLTALLVGPELPSLAGSLFGLIIFVMLLKWKLIPSFGNWDFPSHDSWPGYWEGVVKAGEHVSTSVQRKIGVFKAWLPYVIIGILLLISRLPVFGVDPVLRLWSIGWKNILGTSISRGIEPFYNPGVFPFLFVALLIPYLHGLSWKAASRAWVEVIHMIIPAAIALVFALSMVYIMMNSGEASSKDSMLIVLARAAASFTGDIWYLMAPLVGILGAFVSGSATVSNIMFGPFQFGTAQSASIPVTPILSLQAIGGAAGNMICIHNVVAVLTTVGLIGKEGLLIRQNIPLCILYGLICGIAAWIISSIFLPGIF
ncbi:MAG TPA: L-lactate permease [Chitinispirillaceae bacterium]|nr:L-lactate permease [Chitinispirillaceae bacterium]